MTGQGEITSEEKELLAQLRENVKHFQLSLFEQSKSKEDQDLFLVRWIRARDHKLDKASDMLLKSLEWRKEKRADEILGMKLDPYFTSTFTATFPGSDNFGHPIVLVRASEWDMRKVDKDERSLGEFEKFITSYFETVTDRIWKEHENRKLGDLPITQYTMIANFSGYAYGQLANLGALKRLLQFLSVYEAHYPEVLYKAAFLNCPSYFGILLNVVKQVLPAKTMAKFVCYSSIGDWQKDIKEWVDPAILPEEYGGTAEN